MESNWKNLHTVFLADGKVRLCQLCGTNCWCAFYQLQTSRPIRKIPFLLFCIPEIPLMHHIINANRIRYYSMSMDATNKTFSTYVMFQGQDPLAEFYLVHSWLIVNLGGEEFHTGRVRQLPSIIQG